MKSHQNISPQNHILTDADYEKAETDQLRNALKRTYTERFLMMATLMKMNKMFRKAKNHTYSLYLA